MIITLIGLGLILFTVILGIIHKKIDFSNWKAKERIEGFGFVTLFIGLVITISSIIFILINVASYDVEYQNTLHKKEMLEYRIEHMEENITGNEMLYNDIVEFNNELRGVKKWALNPWTSWFNNQDIATIDYIEILEFEGSQYD